MERQPLILGSHACLQGRRIFVARAQAAAIDQSVPLYTKFSQPVYSLATDGVGPSGRGSLNLVTYASPVAIKPDRCFAVGLYLGTLTHANMKAHRRGVLQVCTPVCALRFGPRASALEPPGVQAALPLLLLFAGPGACVVDTPLRPS
jgi:hypothetical protein